MATDRSVSAYLRDLLADDARVELQRRAIAEWDEQLRDLQSELGLPGEELGSASGVVREIRDEYR